MIIEDSFEQQTEQWYRDKAGVPSMSKASEVLTMTGAPSKSAKPYANRLAGEKLLGYAEESYNNADMKRGVKYEPEARWLYEQITGVKVRQVAFVWKNESKNVLCSPDGLRERKGLEIKCPNLSNHVQSLLDKKLPTDKHRQVHGGMWVCDFPEWDFMSYYPGLPPLIITVKRDDALMQCFDVEFIKLINELNRVYAELKGAQ